MVQVKEKQVPNLNNLWNDLSWSWEWFCKFILFTKFEVYFRDLLGALNLCDASFLNFSCGTLASQIFHKCTYFLWMLSLNCPRFTKIYPFLFTLYTCPDNMLIFDQELGRSTDIKLKNNFVLSPIFRFRLTWNYNWTDKQNKEGYYYLHIHHMVLHHW